MNTEKLVTNLEIAHNAIQRESELLNVIENLTKNHCQIEKLKSNILATTDPNALWQRSQQAREKIPADIQGSLKLQKFSTITKAAHRITQTLENIDLPITNNLRDLTLELIDAIDEQLSAQNFETSITLAKCAWLLDESFQDLELYKQTLLETIGKDLYKTSDTNSSITLYFPEAISLDTFSNKTTALNSLIEECCNIVNMSSAEAAVVINKIESGSYFAKISANPLVIAILTAIVTNGTNTLFSNSNSHNELSLKESTETIEKILQIRETLKASGFEIANLDESIKKSTLIISKQLEKFLESSSEIEINNEHISTIPQRRIGREPNKILEVGATKFPSPPSI